MPRPEVRIPPWLRLLEPLLPPRPLHFPPRPRRHGPSSLLHWRAIHLFVGKCERGLLRRTGAALHEFRCCDYLGLGISPGPFFKRPEDRRPAAGPCRSSTTASAATATPMSSPTQPGAD